MYIYVKLKGEDEMHEYYKVHKIVNNYKICKVHILHVCVHSC